MTSSNQQFMAQGTIRSPGAGFRQRPGDASAMAVAVFIILDATGSMAELIAGVVKALLRFTELLCESNLKPLMGLVVFRDQTYGEKTLVMPLGTAPEEIREVLRHTKADGGHDDPESALPAIMHAIEGFQLTPAGAKKVILQISDAPPHDPEAGYTSANVLAAMMQCRVIYFACTPPIPPYTKFANATGGTLFPLEENLDSEAFKDVLLAVARQTIETIRRDGPVLTDEALQALRGISE
jgi:hypothetical protein